MYYYVVYYEAFTIQFPHCFSPSANSSMTTTSRGFLITALTVLYSTNSSPSFYNLSNVCLIISVGLRSDCDHGNLLFPNIIKSILRNIES